MKTKKEENDKHISANYQLMVTVEGLYGRIKEILISYGWRETFVKNHAQDLNGRHCDD